MKPPNPAELPPGAPAPVVGELVDPAFDYPDDADVLALVPAFEHVWTPRASFCLPDRAREHDRDGRTCTSAAWGDFLEAVNRDVERSGWTDWLLWSATSSHRQVLSETLTAELLFTFAGLGHVDGDLDATVTVSWLGDRIQVHTVMPGRADHIVHAIWVPLDVANAVNATGPGPSVTSVYPRDTVSLMYATPAHRKASVEYLLSHGRQSESTTGLSAVTVDTVMSALSPMRALDAHVQRTIVELAGDWTGPLRELIPTATAALANAPMDRS